MSTQAGIRANAVPPQASNWSTQLHGREFGVAWVLAALGGALVISKSQISGHWRLALPLMIMLVYAWYGYQLASRVRNMPALRAARIALLADSLYFLGFLWTLWALIDTFVFRQLQPGEAAFRVFGYALVTTATGMFLRLLLLQFQYTLEDQRELAEATIEEKLAEFTAKISKAGTAIDDFRQKSDNAVAGFKANTESAVVNWTTSLTQAIKSLDANLAKIDADSNKIQGTLTQIHEKSAAELRNSIDAAVELFVAGLQPPLKRLQDANAEFVESVGAGSRLIDTTVADGNENIGKSLGNFQEGVQVATLGVENSLADLGERIRRVRVPEDMVASEVGPQVAQATVGFTELQKSLKDAVAAVRDLSTLVDRTAADGGENIDKSLSHFRERVQATTLGVETSLTDLGERIRRVRVPEDMVASEVKAQVAEMTMGFTELQNSLKGAVAAVGDLSVLVDRTVAGGTENIDKSLSHFQESVKATTLGVETSLTGLGERIRRVIVPEDMVASEVGAQVAQVTIGFSELLKSLKDAVATVRDLSTELSQRPAPRGTFPENITASEVGAQVTTGFSELQNSLKDAVAAVRDLSTELSRRPAPPSRFWEELMDLFL